jgi:hypothetical protein
VPGDRRFELAPAGETTCATQSLDASRLERLARYGIVMAVWMTARGFRPAAVLTTSEPRVEPLASS